ncbi:MAG: hypothetical protein ACK5Q5_18035 [Planctomycetaceae bacterium]
MTKGNLIATSLVGAIPAGALAYFSIMAFLHYSENMATMLQVVNGVTVLVSVLMAMSPIAILIFVRSPSATAEKPPVGAASSAALPVAAAVAEEGSEMEVAQLDEFGSGSAETADEDLSLSGFDDSFPSTSGLSDDEFEFDDSGFEFEDDDESK